MAYRLGVDVGGTNTDAAILDDQLNVIYTVKAHTTKDVQGVSSMQSLKYWLKVM